MEGEEQIGETISRTGHCSLATRSPTGTTGYWCVGERQNRKWGRNIHSPHPSPQTTDESSSQAGTHTPPSPFEITAPTKQAHAYPHTNHMLSGVGSEREGRRTEFGWCGRGRGGRAEGFRNLCSPSISCAHQRAGRQGCKWATRG